MFWNITSVITDSVTFQLLHQCFHKEFEEKTSVSTKKYEYTYRTAF